MRELFIRFKKCPIESQAMFLFDWRLCGSGTHSLRSRSLVESGSNVWGTCFMLSTLVIDRHYYALIQHFEAITGWDGHVHLVNHPRDVYKILSMLRWMCKIWKIWTWHPLYGYLTHPHIEGSTDRGMGGQSAQSFTWQTRTMIDAVSNWRIFRAFYKAKVPRFACLICMRTHSPHIQMATCHMPFVLTWNVGRP